jgi:hypothetical protein
MLERLLMVDEPAFDLHVVLGCGLDILVRKFALSWMSVTFGVLMRKLKRHARWIDKFILSKI